MPAYISFDQESINSIVTRYQSGESSSGIAPHFKVSSDTIRRVLREAGVAVRDSRESHRHLALNESAFDTLSDDACYWAGFLFADGSISDKKNQLTLRLSDRDRSHVEAFRQFMGTDATISTFGPYPISGYTPRPAVGFCVTSPHVCSRLKSLGMRSHNRSLACDALAASPHFWRGLVDGDGSVGTPKRRLHQSATRARLQVVGGEQLLTQLAAFLAPITAPYSPVVGPHKSIWHVVVSGPPAARALAVLYPPGSTALARKATIAAQAVELECRKAAERERLAALRCGCGAKARPCGFCNRCYYRNWRLSNAS